jgi:hypothetical protein
MTINPDQRAPTAKKLWEAGTALGQAYLKFGDPSKAATYRTGPPKGTMMGMFKHMVAVINKTEDQLPPDIATAPQRMAQHNALGTELQNAFIARMAAGELTALGYEHPRRLDDQPRIIPLSAFLRGYRHENDSIKAEGLHFEAVRIVPSSMLVSLPASPVRGRPSSEATIVQAYSALKAMKGGIDFDAPQKRVVEAIQAWLKANKPNDYGDGKGFQKEAIRHAIAPLFKADKAAQVGGDRKL